MRISTRKKEEINPRGILRARVAAWSSWDRPTRVRRRGTGCQGTSYGPWGPTRDNAGAQGGKQRRAPQDGGRAPARKGFAGREWRARQRSWQPSFPSRPRVGPPHRRSQVGGRRHGKAASPASGDGRLREGRVPPGGRAERGGRGQGREGDAEGVAGPARRDLATEKPALSIPPRGGRRLTQP